MDQFSPKRTLVSDSLWLSSISSEDFTNYILYLNIYILTTNFYTVAYTRAAEASVHKLHFSFISISTFHRITSSIKKLKFDQYRKETHAIACRQPN